MKIYIYFIILIFIISCSTDKGVYWCGDHACANNKEKEAYFKKMMIVEVRNLNKINNEPDSVNEKILNQSKTKREKIIIEEKKVQEMTNLEEEQRAKDEIEIEKQIELQEKKLAKQEKELEEKINLEEEEKIISENKKEENLSSINKEVKNSEISSKEFDELVENILIRNSTRSYPKINDIPK